MLMEVLAPVSENVGHSAQRPAETQQNGFGPSCLDSAVKNMYNYLAPPGLSRGFVDTVRKFGTDKHADKQTDKQ